MRLLGLLLSLLGGGGTAAALVVAFRSRRPNDVVVALVAPFALLVALAGAVLLFVPGFFG